MAARQWEISVSEFFTKNRHLLGFDNPQQALAKHGLNYVIDAYLPEKLKHPERFLP